MAELYAPPGRGKNPTNRTDDIDGAQPMTRFAYAQPDWKEEIEGSRPKPSKHAREMRRPDLFNVRDIEGAKAKKSHFRTTRSVNPLEPEYKLPSFEPIVYETPRFVRDSFDVSDIEGTKTRTPQTFETRNSYDVSDIEGTSASWAPWHKTMIKKLRENYGSRKVDPLHVRDITEKGFKSRRVVDPLRPEYFIHGNEVRDCDRTTAPRKLFRETNAPFFSLHTKDIRGAQGGSGSVFKRLRAHERKVFRKTNEVSDIDGATTGTLRRGLRSKRQTDPLQPRYRFLHGAQTPTPPDETSREAARTAREPASEPAFEPPSSNQFEDQAREAGFAGAPADSPGGAGPADDDEFVRERQSSRRSFIAAQTQAPDVGTGDPKAPPGMQWSSSMSGRSSSRSSRSSGSKSGRSSRSGRQSETVRSGEDKNPLSARSAPSSRRSGPMQPPPLPLQKMRRPSGGSSRRSVATVQARQELNRQAEISSVRDLPDFDVDL